MHAVLAFSALPLFLGALLSDWAYSASHQVQWLNFAAWLMAGGLLVTSIALAWAAVALWRLRAPRPRTGPVYLLLLLATFVLGLVNALVHARDGWATMPTGLLLSIVVLAVAVLASAAGLAAWPRRPA